MPLTADTGSPPSQAPPSTPLTRRDLLRPWVSIAVDVALPLSVYYLASHLGASTSAALVLSALGPAVRTVWTTLRERNPDTLAVAVLLVTLVSIPIVLSGGSPRFLLAKEGLLTGPVGVWLLWTARGARPVMTPGYRAALVRDTAAARAWQRREAEDPAFRRTLAAVTAAWGVWALIAFVAHLVCALALPLHTAIWATNLVVPGMIVGASLTTAPFSNRLRAALEADREQEETS